MATLTPEQVYALAKSLGASDEWAIRIAGAVGTESGGRTDAIQSGGQGRGLLQIDLGQHPDVTLDQAMDPTYSMQWALNATGGDPSKIRDPLWYGPEDNPSVAQTWQAQAAATANSGGSNKTSTGHTPADLTDFSTGSNPLSQLFDMAKTITKTGAWLSSPHNWVRVMEVITGLLLLGMGLWEMSPTARGAGGAIVRNVPKVIPI